MKRQKRLIVGNWKMNPVSLAEAKKLASSVKKSLRNLKKTEVVICPPFVYLASLSNIPGKSIYLGAQNAKEEEQGSFTGEVSWSELTQFKVNFVIVGHSDRRKMGETDEIVNKKVKAIVSGGMSAIICVGESVRDHHGDYFGFIKTQIHGALKDVPRKFLDKIIIAYEPIWAIGAKYSMTHRDLLETSIFIKKVLRDFCGTDFEDVRVLYGGSVNTANADLLIKEGNVSGLLIGRESLDAKDFVEIIKLVDSI